MKTIISRLAILFYLLASCTSCSSIGRSVLSDENVTICTEEKKVILQAKSPFEANWLVSSDDQKKWFAIKLTAEELNIFSGYLIDSGSLALKIGTKVLEFHQVGDEYWGKIQIADYGSCPCKLVFEGLQKITIREQRNPNTSYSYFNVYHVKRFAEDSETAINHESSEEAKLFTDHSTEPSTLFSSEPGKIASSSIHSLSGGYGEISSITGRPKTVAVRGYHRKDGTYVRPHHRSSPRR